MVSKLVRVTLLEVAKPKLESALTMKPWFRTTSSLHMNGEYIPNIFDIHQKRIKKLYGNTSFIKEIRISRKVDDYI